MADVTDPFAGWVQKGEKPVEKKAATKGVEVADPFADWGKKEEKAPEKPDMLKGSVQAFGRGARVAADAVMGAIGTDLRTESGTTRKPGNFVEGMAQNIAKSSREEVDEQNAIGPIRAFGARVAGAATGFARLGEDFENAKRGAVYNAGESLRGAIGSNPIEDLRRAADAVDARGNKTAPALGILLGMVGGAAPAHGVEEDTKRIGQSLNAPRTVESGQGDIVNAIPFGRAAGAGAGGLRAMAKAGLEAGATMGGLTAVQTAGRESQASGKGFDTGRAVKEGLKSGTIAGVAGGLIHAGANGFSRTPKSAGTRPDAHARETVISKTPIEPVPDSVKQALDRSAKLERGEKRAARVTDRALEAGKQAADLEVKGEILDQGPRAKAMGERVASVRRGFDRKENARAAERAKQEALESEQTAALNERGRQMGERVSAVREQFDATAERHQAAQEKVDKVRKLADMGYEQAEFVPKNVTPEPLPEPVKPALDKEKNVNGLTEQMTGGKSIEELKATIGDRTNSSPEQRRQAKLELKKLEPKAEKEDAGPLGIKRFKNIDADKPPESPSAPPPKEDGIITRAEYKRRTVESRPADEAETKRYGKIAEATAEHDYHQRRYEAGLQQLATELGVQEPKKKMSGSNERALSVESGELHRAVAEKISEMRKLAGQSDEPTIDVYHKTFMGEHKIEPLTGKTAKEKYAELEGIKREADRWKGERESQVEGIRGTWKAKSEPAYKVEDKTYLPVQVTASDGTKHYYNIITKEGGKKVMDAKAAQAEALKKAKSEHGAIDEAAHPRAITVKTGRGDVLLESYRQKPAFRKADLERAEAVAGNKPEFQEAKKSYLELKQRNDKAGEYIGVDYPELHKMLKGEIQRFFTEESGSGRAGIALDIGEGVTKAARDVADIWATHVIDKNKRALEDFLSEREVVRDITGASDKSKWHRVGDVIRIAMAQKNDMDWVRSYSPELAEGLTAIRSIMEHEGQSVPKLEDSLAAREEFVDAVEMTPQAVRDHDWKHLTKDQANFIANITELRAEAADMVSDVWDEWHDQGISHSFEGRHLGELYKAYTGGVDIKTGLRQTKSGLDKTLDHLMTGAYDAMVTGNKRIHTLHVADALTMGTSVVHPANLAKAAKEYSINPDVREFLASYQGAGVYKQTRGSRLSWWEKNIGKAFELSAQRLLGKKGLETARLLEGGWMERRKIELIRGAAILRAGKEMGYKGNLLQDVAREYKTGKSVLTPVERTELSIRVLNQLEDAFGYNPAGFVNRNAFRQTGLDRIFPFMGVRSVQNRLLGKFVAERNWKGLLTLMVATQALAGSAATFLPVEKALQFASPETYIQYKHLMDFLSIAGVSEFALRKSGAMTDENEQNFAPFLRRIEHIQPEVIPWLFNSPTIVMDIFKQEGGITPSKVLLGMSAIMGGSSLAGITTPVELERLWRYIGKGMSGAKNMGVYERGVFGEKRISTKKDVPTTALRELINHLLPAMDSIDERYASEAKFGAATKVQLMRNGYDAKEVKSIMNTFYRSIHKSGRVADAHDFIELIHEHSKK